MKFGPTGRLVVALVLCLPPFVLALWVPGLERLGWAAAAVVALLAAVDALFAPRRESLEVELDVPPVLSLADEQALRIRVRNRTGSRARIEVRAVLPEEWKVDRLVEPIDLPPFGTGEAVWRVVPRRRGKYLPGPVHLRVPGPLGFTRRDLLFDLRAEVKVYPAVGSIRKHELLARRLRSREMGLRAHRQRGQGLEFARLRDYHHDDEPRLIDWKATARRGRFISREYQVERCQNVVLLIDAGRMLTEEVDGIVKIEYVLNAALLLTKIASRYDDRVGALVFSDKVDRLTPLRKGHAAVGAMAEALYDVEPRLVEPDYEAAFAALGTRLRKRALVILFTNLVDQETSGLVSGYLRGLAARHVPVCVAVGDRETRDVAWSVPAGPEDAYRKAAAAHLLTSRDHTLQQLRRAGVRVVDAPAGQVPVQVLDQYLDLKARQVV
ncbi:MAG TPA: DUF58 domain-containing protein [Planctomycetota bacterium]